MFRASLRSLVPVLRVAAVAPSLSILAIAGCGLPGVEANSDDLGDESTTDDTDDDGFPSTSTTDSHGGTTGHSHDSTGDSSTGDGGTTGHTHDVTGDGDGDSDGETTGHTHDETGDGDGETTEHTHDETGDGETTEHSHDETGDGDGDGDGDINEPICSPPLGACQSVICNNPNRGASHVSRCTPLTWEDTPPTSGTHYSIWAKFLVYAEPVAPGFFVHSMEHGAIVLQYNCALDPDNCATLPSELAAYKTSFGQDPLCDTVTVNRIMVTPSDAIETPFAASAWDWSMTADCFDPAVMAIFAGDHYAQTYEDICGGGVDLTDPASGYPDDCGF